MKSKLIIITVTIILLAAILGGCGPLYKTFVLHEDYWRYMHYGSEEYRLEHPSFTFEYPRNFHSANSGNPGVFDPTVTCLWFFRSLRKQHLPELISIIVHRPNSFGYPEDTDPKSAVDNQIDSELENKEPYHRVDNLVILDRGSVSVAGQNAEYAVYSYQRQMLESNLIKQFMCFEYADFLWRFELESHAINWEENTVRFQHLLETFRFLDNPYAR